QLAAMAAVGHQYVTMVLAMEAMFSSIGGAIGQAIAAAIWTGAFPEKLARYLPAEEQGNLTNIYGALAVQLSYPMGSPTRHAIAQAYGATQRLMLITATAILAVGVVSIFLWRDINVKHIKQVKGTVI
ncbi:MFS siderochrome iron transporter 1, partial [Spiromyces aspiralis]